MLRPEDVWHPRVGAPPGNRNRLKHGHYTNGCKALRRGIAEWRRETRALLACAERELVQRELEKAADAMKLLRPRARGREGWGEGDCHKTKNFGAKGAINKS